MIKSLIPFLFFVAIVQCNFVEELENFEDEIKLSDLFIAAEYVSPCEAEFNSVKSCLSDVSANYNVSDPRSLLDKDLMVSIIQDFENSSCFAPSDCANVKVAKHIYDTLIFIGVEIYYEGFECVLKIVNDTEALEETAKHCANVILLSGTVELDSVSAILAVIKPLGDCIIERQQCTPVEKEALIAAVHKGVDLFAAYKNPEVLLKELNLTKADISKEELTNVFLFFAHF